MAAILEHPAFQPLPRGVIPLPSETELAWLGGFVDGEGTISLTIARSTGDVRPEFSVANTSLENLGRARVVLHAVLGHDLLPRLLRNETRPAFALDIHRHEDARKVLMALRPWLVGKRPQADLMLEYLATCSAALQETHRRGPHTPEQRSRRLELAARMRDLNRRYRRGEWVAAHPDLNIDRAAIASKWQAMQGQRSVEDERNATRTLWRLRGKR